MIDWLRREASTPETTPEIMLAGRTLPIELRHHPRAKRLTLRLAPDGKAVLVTLPKWCASREAVDFARARASWLEGQLAKIPPVQDPIANRCLPCRGRELAIDWREDAPRKPILTGDTLALGGPEDTLEHRLMRWLGGEAHRLFTHDAAYYCERASLPLAPVKLSRARRRWGSCSSEGVLRLNWRLVMAPDFVHRSVVAHEVAHLVHFDHSPAFHAMLAQLYESDIKAANSWLSRHGRTLYTSFI